MRRPYFDAASFNPAAQHDACGIPLVESLTVWVERLETSATRLATLERLTSEIAMRSPVRPRYLASLAPSPTRRQTPRPPPTFEITSFREHSKVLRMFTFCERNGQSRLRHVRFAASARAPKAAIIVDGGVMPTLTLTIA